MGFRLVLLDNATTKNVVVYSDVFVKSESIPTSFGMGCDFLLHLLL